MVQTVKKNWWGRNWKWLVPTGCLSSLLILAAFVAVILTIVSVAMKSSDVYQQAMQRARANPAVVEALGTPITDGFLASGSVNTSGSSGNANLSNPISGSKGSATIVLQARKSGGEWSYSTLRVEIGATGRRIDLMR